MLILVKDTCQSATMWRSKSPGIALAIATILVTSVLIPPEVATAQELPGSGAEMDTMYDLEGSTGDQFLGSGDADTGSGSTGSGSGSGSGSGDGSPGRHCRLPPPGTFPEPAGYESDVLPEIQCHLACIEHVSLRIVTE